MSRYWFQSLLVGAFALAGFENAFANGEIFPPEPAAQSAITWKDDYFVINGKPTFITSGEMHYARIPRELWRDRIWRSKMMGFNCMQMYVFWNASEGKEGQWTFQDNLDLDAWLTDIQSAGMYAVVRVGPYSCAEWEHGGFPAWLTAKPGMTLRDMGPDFIHYADLHLAQVEKIVAKHQINHGGNVLMVQLENEHPRGWGTDGNDYLKHLYDQARVNGLEIPLFFSGLHHGGDPSGESPYKPDPSPWFTTEFWTGWIGRYGDMPPAMLQQKIAGTWKIIAFGGAGYDYYMVHGGTNFGYSGDSLMTSYDYSAPIGETGHFNNFYFYAKRAAWLARSFSDLLTGSGDNPTFATTDAKGLRVTTRSNPALGSLVMIDNFSNKVDISKLPEIPPDATAYQAPSADKNGAISTRLTVGGVVLPHTGSFKVSATDPMTVLFKIPWSGTAKFDSICSRVLLKTTLGDKLVFVCYGDAGDTGEVNLSTMPKPIDFTYPKDQTVDEIPLSSPDGHKALLLIENTEMTKKTWLAKAPSGEETLFFGPEFVRDNGDLEWLPAGGSGVAYTAGGKAEIHSDGMALDPLPALSTWNWRDGAPERNPNYDCTSWVKSQGLVPMGRLDGYQNRYGWYKTSFKEDSAKTVGLKLAGYGGDRKMWLNGALQTDLNHLSLVAGDNSLAILVKASPRPKWFGYLSYTGSGGYKGIWGGISEDYSGMAVPVTWSKWTGKNGQGSAPNLKDASAPDISAEGWTPAPTLLAKKGDNVFRGTFTLDAKDTDAYLNLSGAGSLFIVNGRVYDSSDPEVKLLPGTNSIVVSINLRAEKDEREIKPNLELWHNSPIAHATWLTHGGLDDLDETAIVAKVTNWDDFLKHSPWNEGAPKEAGVPTFWHTAFRYHLKPGTRETIGLIDTNKYLKSGNVWLNGHNLGECPEKEPLYMPECWMKEGANDLVIFDMEGNSPAGVSLARYEGFIERSPIHDVAASK